MENKGRTSLDMSEDEILIMADKIRQNQIESKEFERRMESCLNNRGEVTEPIPIGKTPNALVISGADGKLNVIINPSTIKKCMSDSAARYHGHGLTADIMKRLPDELRNPVMIFKGAHQNSLVAVTALKDKKKDVIIVAVDLNVRSVWCDVNRVTSAYGKKNVCNYIKKQFETGNLVAVNVEKANEMLHSLGLQLPQENTFISFDNSIAYTMANVKYPDEMDNQKNYKKENKAMENNVMEQTQETKKTLFSVEQNGFTSYYDMGVMSFEELRQHFMESEHPFKGLGGKEVSESDFAWLEQSDEVFLSVTADIDNDMIRVYEINGIPEEERTGENTRIWKMELSEYVSEKQNAMGQAEEIINRLESSKTVFNNDERNLIVNYAYKLNDIEKTRELAERIYYNHGNQEAILAEREAQAEIGALPDTMIGISQMNEYGYTSKDMLPLTQEGAMELFEQNLSVYVLHKDGTETVVEDREQIMEHAGIFGIEKDEWLQMLGIEKNERMQNQNKFQEQPEKKNSLPVQSNKKEAVQQAGKKESVLSKLKLFQNKAKEQNAAKETPIRSKETSIDK